MRTKNTLSLSALTTALGLAALSPAAWAQTSNPPPPPPRGEPGVESDGDGVNDDIDAEPCNLQVASKRFEPADRTWGMLLFEDRWPNKGDFDFNDLVLAYNEVLDYDSANQLTGIRLDLRVIAVGARYTNGLAFRIPGAPKSTVLNMRLDVGGVSQNVSPRITESDLVVDLASDLHALFGASTQEWINTDTSVPAKPYVDIVLDIRFSPGQNIAAADAPFDLFLFNSARGTEVHRPRYQGTASINGSLFGTADDGSTPGRAFVTKNGIPFALELPETALYPKEGVAIDLLYPAIVDFGLGLPGAETFYQSPQVASAFGSISVGAFSASPAVDVSCFAPNPGVCGAAANVGSVDAPTAALCGFGAASTVTSQGGFHQWTCAGNYSSPTACDAPTSSVNPGCRAPARWRTAPAPRSATAPAPATGPAP
jgi:LruC domain-containing protein